MSTHILSTAELDALRRYNTPTISNAIELFDVRPRHLGFLPHTSVACFPTWDRSSAMPSRPGPGLRGPSSTKSLPICSRTTYATLPLSPARRSRSAGTLTSRRAWGPSSARSPRPSTRKLGCVGHITSGCPRDLDEVHALGFQLFGLNPCVSHAYVRLVDFGTPVMIGGVEIHSGDLIHADKHGVCLIPHEVAPKLAEACAEVERRERPILEICRSENFSLEEYIKLRVGAESKIRE